MAKKKVAKKSKVKTGTKTTKKKSTGAKATEKKVNNVGPIKQVDPKELSIHKLNAKFFGAMGADEFAKLKDDIKANGIRVPLIVTKDMEIIAGKTRLKIAKALKLKVVPVTIVGFPDEEAVARAVVGDNILRRQLIKSEKVRIGKELEVMFKKTGGVEKPGRPKKDKAGKAKDQKKKVGAKYVKTGKTAADKAAEEMGISPTQYQDTKRAVKVPNEVVKRLDAGDISITLSGSISKLPPEGKKKAASICKKTENKKVLKEMLEALVKSFTGEDANADKIVKKANILNARLLDFIDNDLAPVWANVSEGKRTEFIQSFRQIQTRIVKMKEDVNGDKKPADKKKKKAKK